MKVFLDQFIPIEFWGTADKEEYAELLRVQMMAEAKKNGMHVVGKILFEEVTDAGKFKLEDCVFVRFSADVRGRIGA